MKRRTDEEIEDKVEKLLRELGLWGVRWLDLMTVLVELKRQFAGFKGYERVPDELLPEAEAQWDSIAGVLRMRESVFRGMQRNEVRARNTVAEEIGHFAFGHAGIRNRSVARSGAEKSVPQIMHEEAEAKRFAPRLLSPAKLVSEQATVDDIAATFGLSRTSAAIRREELDRFRRRAAGHERELPSFVVDFLAEAQRRGVKIRTKID